MTTQATMDLGRPPAAPSSEQDLSAHAVSAGFRLRYMVRLGLAVLCGAAVGGAIVYVLLARGLGDYAVNMPIISGVRKSVVGASVLSGLIQAALTGAMVAALALFASHKIVGPAVRLMRLLRGVARGELPGPVRLRQGDQVGKLESRFNEVSRLLCERHELLGRKLDDVRAAELQLRRALMEPGAREERQAAACQLRERASELAGILARVGRAPEHHRSG